MRLADQGQVNIVFDGFITNVNGQECQVAIRGSSIEFGSPYPDYPACEYSLVLASHYLGQNFQTEYMGNARILQTGKVRDGIPGEALLHFSLPVRSRPIRRHDRLDCARWTDIIPGLALLDGKPQSRQQLLSFFHHYFRKPQRKVPTLINISPGGVCLRTEDVIARRLMSSQDRYLFFFFLKSLIEERMPQVFLGRKAGVFRVPQSAANDLRIQFLNELEWTDNSQELQWHDIAHSGSENLRRILEDLPQEQDENSGQDDDQPVPDNLADAEDTADCEDGTEDDMEDDMEDDEPPGMPIE